MSPPPPPEDWIVQLLKPMSSSLLSEAKPRDQTFLIIKVLPSAYQTQDIMMPHDRDDLMVRHVATSSLVTADPEPARTRSALLLCPFIIHFKAPAKVKAFTSLTMIYDAKQQEDTYALIFFFFLQLSSKPFDDLFFFHFISWKCF